MLGIVTSYYNPVGYKNPERNYSMFRDGLGELAEHLFTAEMSLSERFYVKDSLQLRGYQKNLLWQKESLINEAVRRMPPKYTHVAWVDSDLLFNNLNWYREAWQKLQVSKAVQLFDEVVYTDSDLNDQFSKRGFAAEYRSGHMGSCCQGGGWAASRDLFPLSPFNIMGGGDCAHSYAFVGDWDERYRDHMTPQWELAEGPTFDRLRRTVSGKVDFIDGAVRHLYHGTREDRRYSDRTDCLKQFDYDPRFDVRVGSNGLLEWSSPKPDMHRLVGSYFGERDEDSLWLGDFIEEEVLVAGYFQTFSPNPLIVPHRVAGY